MKKLCRCGRLVDDRCPVCSPQQNTTDNGYDWQWRQLSERKRQIDPLCEVCLKADIVTPAEEVHHIAPIKDAPQLRLIWSNLLSVCVECHRKIERGCYDARTETAANGDT